MISNIDKQCAILIKCSVIIFLISSTSHKLLTCNKNFNLYIYIFIKFKKNIVTYFKWDLFKNYFYFADFSVSNFYNKTFDPEIKCYSCCTESGNPNGFLMGLGLGRQAAHWFLKTFLNLTEDVLF